MSTHKLIDRQPVTIEAREALNVTPGIRSGTPFRDAADTMSRKELLGSYGKPGLVEEMIFGHPRIAAHIRGTCDAAAYADYSQMVEWESDDYEGEAPTADETAFAEQAERLIFNLRTDVVNDQGDFGAAMGELTEGRYFGHSVQELSLVPTPWTEDGYTLECYRVHQSSIWRWDFEGADADKTIWKANKLTEIQQYAETGGARIPAEDLVVVSWGMFPVGMSALRPLVYWYETAKEAVYSYSERLYHESGVVMVHEHGGGAAGAFSDRQSAATVDELIDQYATTKGMKVVRLSGPVKDFSVQYPSGTATDVTIYLKYADGMIDQLLEREASTLGLTAGSGSRALGEVMALKDRERHIAALNNQVGRWSRQVYRWLAVQLGYADRNGVPTVRLPWLEVVAPSEGLSVMDRASVWTSVGQSLPQTPETREWIASAGAARYALPSSTRSPARTVCRSRRTARKTICTLPKRSSPGPLRSR